MNCICKTLLRSKDMENLTRFLYSLPKKFSYASEDILRARAAAAYHCGAYQEVYRILESHDFSPE